MMNGFNRVRSLIISFLFSAVIAGSAFAGNLHLVSSAGDKGYRLYRTGKPTREDYKKLCALGVTQMIVLSGDAEEVEMKYQADCPQMEIIYNERQNNAVPVSSRFLQQFDEWIRLAKEKGTKIAFRCNCGCHRTGRLAAYYNMKYRGMSAEQAISDMFAKGTRMFMHPELSNQVRALSDYIRDGKCSQTEWYCVDYQAKTRNSWWMGL